MRIRRLDISGFKSFADRTVIKFGNGITGVVGPNGCGKSNVVDALRWVMGEQRAKHLRGGQMTDVIFNGSTIRGPMGLAEVSVTFENDGHLIPAEYANFSEIQVTRRLYRDGESDYEINQTPCRLRDIHDLFLGTGLGKQGFSIIEQGQVATIIKSKPEDRRRLIEEAAGITKYKARRQAAERKMAATEQNLLRISDVIREVSRRLGSLKRQATKAERYKEYRTEVRDIELHQAVLKYFELTNQLGVEQALLQGEQDQLVGDETKIAVLETQAETARIQLLEDDKRLSAAQARTYELDNQIALLEQRMTHAKEALEVGDTRKVEQQEELAGLKEAIELIRVQRDNLARGAEDLVVEAEDKQGRLAEAEQALEQITARRVVESKDVDELRRTMLEASTRLAGGQSTLTNLDERLADIATQQDQAGAAIQEAQAQHAQAGQQIGALEQGLVEVQQERARTAEQKQTTEQAALQVAQQVSALDEDILARREALTEVTGKLNSLQEIEAALSRSPEGVRQFMQKHGAKLAVHGLLADAIIVDAEHEVMVSAALSDRLSAALVEDEDLILNAIVELRESGEGQGFFALLKDAPKDEPYIRGARPLSLLVKAKPGFEKFVPQLLADVYVLDEGADLRQVWAMARARGVNLCTKDGTVLCADGRARGGSADEADSGLLRQKREIRDLTEKAAQERAVLDELNAQKAERTEQKRTLDEQVQALAQALQDIEQRYMDGTQALNRQKDEVTRLLREVTDRQAQSEKLAEQHGQLTGQREQLLVTIAELEQTKRAADEKLKTAADSQAALDHEIKTKGDEVTRLKVEVAAAVERKENLKQTLAHHEQNETDIQTRIGRLDEQLQSYERDREDIMRTEVESKTRIEELMKERTEVKGTLDVDREKYEKAAETVRALEGEVRGLRAGLDSARKRQNEIALSVREAELSLENLEQRCQSNYGISPTEAIFDYHLAPEPDFNVKDRLAELRKKMDNLGEINLTAIDEYHELEERYDFLKTQSDDLTHALEQLSRAIVKINRTTKKRFKEAFEQINAQFEKVFPRLFKGGKAWLALTDPNDLLQTGVEIYAQPPGKKLQSVALMSGGEQALTAVSLIFAIFLIKPSPFCLLDEVDAPLDESNVSRFNELIKDVSNISQFIVITHNKRTMEAVDQLYGITMEQPGVSKAVSVRVS